MMQGVECLVDWSKSQVWWWWWWWWWWWAFGHRPSALVSCIVAGKRF